MKPRVPMGLSVAMVRWVQTTEKVLTSLQAMRTGGPLSKVLGSLVMAGTVAETLMPRWYPDIALRQYGFEKVDSGASRFFGDVLRNSTLTPKSHTVGDGGQMIDLWTPPGAREAKVATLSSGRWGGDDSIFVKVGYDPAPLFREIVWKKGSALMVSAQMRGATGLRYNVRVMAPPGRYVGTPDPRVVASRLMKARSETRSLLLAGPTGSGKSTMARVIAQEVAGGQAKTLKIAGSVLKLCPFEVALDLATYLQPTVLLLDDVPIASKVQMDDLLALFEALHGRTKLIISTYMDDERLDDDDGDGSDYWPGMRPGRIDEVERTKRPSLENRKVILREYLGEIEAPLDDLAEACEGLTGAYLKEVAYRVSRYGLSQWKDEVKAVRRTAPFPKKKESPAPEVAGGTPPANGAAPKSVKELPFTFDGVAR